MTAIPFVDAHVHLWDLDHLRYAWLTPPFSEDGPNGSTEAIAVDYRLDDYLSDVAGWDVRGVVHVDAGADPRDAVAETEWLEGIAATRGLPSAIVAFAALHEPDVEALLERQASHPHVRGIRHIVNWHADPRRTYTPADLSQDDRWRAGYGLLAKYGLSFDLQCYPAQAPALAPLIDWHDDVPVFINHVGMPVTTDRDGIAQWRYGMRELAAFPHVAIKLSGVGFIDRAWTLDGIRPFILEAIEIFGTSRCMFASDAPTDKLFAPLDRYLDAYHGIVADFSDDERRDLFGRNANRLYRLDLLL